MPRVTMTKPGRTLRGTLSDPAIQRNQDLGWTLVASAPTEGEKRSAHTQSLTDTVADLIRETAAADRIPIAKRDELLGQIGRGAS